MPAPADGLTTLTFIALPRNVVTNNGAFQWLELSAFVTIRLLRAPGSNSTADLTLRDFPDLLRWPTLINPMRFNIEFLGRDNSWKRFPTNQPSGAPPQVLAKHIHPNETPNPWTTTLNATQYSQLWEKLFPPDMTVVPLTNETVNTETKSFDAIGAEEAIQQRLKAIQGQSNSSESIPNSVTKDVNNYHKEISKKVPLQKTNVKEFHTQLSALGEYPSLLRQLFLILDFRIPWSPDFDREKNFEWGRVLVRPDWKETDNRKILAWPTAYQLDFPSDGPIETTMFRTRLRAEEDPPTSPPVDRRRFRDNLLNLGRKAALTDPTSQSTNVFRMGQIDALSGYLQVVADAPESNQRAASVRTTGLAIYQRDLPAEIQEAVSADDQRVAWFAEHVNAERNFASHARSPLSLLQAESVQYAENVQAGYRVDIRVDKNSTWYSLHKRRGEYSLPGFKPVPVDDEGWVSFTPLSTSTDSSNRTLAFPNTLFTWNGWSLSARRPGPVLVTKETADSKVIGEEPKKETELNQGDGRLRVKVSADPGTLPRLRFGNSYSIRIRPVDLVGNSHTLPSANLVSKKSELHPATLSGVFRRYEPVPGPIIIPGKPAGLASSASDLALDQMVFRSSESGSSTSQPSVRYLIPPATTVQMIEWHGMLEKWKIQVPGQPPQGFGTPAQYEELKNRNDARLAEWISVDAPSNNLVNYLPDPLAQGIKFWNLPPSRMSVSPSQTDFAFYENSAAWPVARPWRLVFGLNALVMDNPTPMESKDLEWSTISLKLTAHDRAVHIPRLPPKIRDNYVRAADEAFRIADQASFADINKPNREIRIFMPKGRTTTLYFSSLLAPADLSLLGVWQEWLSGVLQDDQVLTRPNELLWPTQKIKLIHAVARPTFDPLFLTLGDVEERFGFFNAKSLTAIVGKAAASSFIKIRRVASPERKISDAEKAKAQESLGCEVLAAIYAPTASSYKLDLNARWQEVIDRPQDGTPPRITEVRAVAFSHDIEESSLNDDDKKIPTTFMEEKDTTVQLLGRHEFGDERHRFVQYSATAYSRYARFFPGDPLQTARSSDVQLQDGTRPDNASGYVCIPSAARPPAPDIAFVIPIFHYKPSAAGLGEKRGETDQQQEYVRLRRGGGVRVYLRRPWFETGVDELLGVALLNKRPSPRTSDSDSPCKGESDLWSKVSLWGQDPLQESSTFGPLRAESFRNHKGEGIESGLVYAPAIGTAEDQLQIVGYPVTIPDNYVSSRDLYAVDIILDNPPAYFPFLRLGLCRYQPFALPGLELSEIVTANIIQLAPDRMASIIFSDDAKTCAVSLYGNPDVYFGPRSRNLVEVRIEVPLRRVDDAQREEILASDRAWEEFRTQPLALMAEGPNPYWHGVIDVREAFGGPDKPRLTFREYEVYGDPTNPQKRLVYSDSIWLNPNAK